MRNEKEPITACRVMAVVNQKGGTGKSGLSVSLSVGLARIGKKVLLIDMDPQADATASLGFRDTDESDETIATLMQNVISDEDLPEDMYILKSDEGVDLIPSSIDLASLEVTLVNAMSREFVLKQIISVLRDRYEYIILDNMPSLGMITINALTAADEIIIPVEASYLPMKGLQELLRTVGRVRRQLNPFLEITGIVFTMVDTRTTDARQNMQLLRDEYGAALRIFDTHIPFSVRAKECCKEGMSIFRYKPKAKVTRAYEALIREVLDDGREE